MRAEPVVGHRAARHQCADVRQVPHQPRHEVLCHLRGFGRAVAVEGGVLALVIEEAEMDVRAVAHRSGAGLGVKEAR